jgi:RNA polymerase sigma-70 factor (ECF subfamily)
MDNQYRNDEELFEGLKRGEDAPMKSLFDSLFEKMVRLAFKITQSESEAQDVAIIAFTKTIQSMHTLRNLNHVKNYWRRTVRNASINFATREKSRKMRHDEIGYFTETVEDQIFNDLVKAELANGIIEVMEARCNEKQQKVLTLHFIDGLTPAEIGALMGISPANVRRIRSDALKVLRKFF